MSIVRVFASVNLGFLFFSFLCSVFLFVCFIFAQGLSFFSGLDVQVPLLLKKGAASFVQSASTDPFTIEWYMKMTDNADLNKDIESHFTLKDPRFHSTPTLLDFAIVYEAFYKHHKVRPVLYVGLLMFYTSTF